MPSRSEVHSDPNQEERYASDFWSAIACSSGRIKKLKEKIGSRSHMDSTLVDIAYDLFHKGKVFYNLRDIEGSIDLAVSMAREIDNVDKIQERQLQHSS